MNDRLKLMARQLNSISDELSRGDLCERDAMLLQEQGDNIREEISRNGYDLELFKRYVNEGKSVKVPDWFKGNN
ncbi:hypothetical protein [Bacillus cereus]|uniref:hypothetical protein n=1 Tax=Bacillus cereus TaxID=1396 RepID=UPI003980D986